MDVWAFVCCLLVYICVLRGNDRVLLVFCIGDVYIGKNGPIVWTFMVVGVLSGKVGGFSRDVLLVYDGFNVVFDDADFVKVSLVKKRVYVWM